MNLWANASTKEDYRISGRPVSAEVIQGLLEAEYEMILNQLR